MKKLLIVLFSTSVIGMNAQDNPVQSIELVENAQLIFEGHMVHFEQVISDSRCPKDVTCVMAGWAMVKLTIIETGNQNERSFDLKIPATLVAETMPLVFKNQEGALLIRALTPYPISTQVFEARDYCLQLVWQPY